MRGRKPRRTTSGQQATRHVTEGRRIVASQRALISRQKLASRDTLASESLLAQLKTVSTETLLPISRYQDYARRQWIRLSQTRSLEEPPRCFTLPWPGLVSQKVSRATPTTNDRHASELFKVKRSRPFTSSVYRRCEPRRPISRTPPCLSPYSMPSTIRKSRTAPSPSAFKASTYAGLS